MVRSKMAESVKSAVQVRIWPILVFVADNFLIWPVPDHFLHLTWPIFSACWARPRKSWSWHSARPCLFSAKVFYDFVTSTNLYYRYLQGETFCVYLSHDPKFQSTGGLCHLGGHLKGATTCDGVPGSAGRLRSALLAWVDFKILTKLQPQAFIQAHLWVFIFSDNWNVGGKFWPCLCLAWQLAPLWGVPACPTLPPAQIAVSIR